MDIRGRKIIVTGGVSGLGRCLVEKLVAMEASVSVLDMNVPGLDELKKHHPEVNVVECDVTNYDQVLTVSNHYGETFGAADVLINNAGKLYSAPLVRLTSSGIEKHDVEMWNRVLATNLTSVYYMTSCFVEKMITSRTKGVIVNIGSVSASGNAGASAYSAAKAGVHALTVAWARELSAIGIRVVAVAPGFADTQSTKEALSQAALEATIKRVPLRRLGKPEEIAAGVLFVIQNDFFNGKVLELDGGLSLG